MAAGRGALSMPATVASSLNPIFTFLLFWSCDQSWVSSRNEGQKGCFSYQFLSSMATKTHQSVLHAENFSAFYPSEGGWDLLTWTNFNDKDLLR